MEGGVVLARGHNAANASELGASDLYLSLALLKFGRTSHACAGRAKSTGMRSLLLIGRSYPHEVKVGSQA
jgi:hypothetical protein